MSEPSVPPPPSYTPPPPPPPGGMPPTPGSASPNRQLMIVLSYLGPLAFIPFLVEKDDPEVQWHARHGIVLLVAEIAIAAALWVFSFVIAMVDFTGCAGCSGCVIQMALMVAILVVHGVAIFKGVNGQRLIIPYVSQYADRF